MSDFDYWKRQSKTALFPEVDTWQPEQRRFAGKLLIIGGNKGAFYAAAKAMETANKMGVGEVRVLLPDSLRGKLPKIPEIYFAKAEASGAFGKASMADMWEHLAWAEAVLIAGDLGRNAETSVAFAEFMKHCDKPITIARDGVDVLIPDVMNWGMRDEKTTLFLTMPQLQKLLRTLYYPKVITLSMPMNQLIETLHKFTLSYPLTFVTYHEGQIVIARDGQVISEELADTDYSQISLWDGSLQARVAVLSLWNREFAQEQVAARALLKD
jgi:hypothetical protein